MKRIKFENYKHTDLDEALTIFLEEKRIDENRIVSITELSSDSVVLWVIE